MTTMLKGSKDDKIDGPKACAGVSEEVRAGESDEACKEVVRIDVAQLLGPWGQRLAVTLCSKLPMAAQDSPQNAYRLLATLI
jgi:hypothetical protein